MHLSRPGSADHVNEPPGGSASNDGIVYHHHALATKHFTDRVVLHLHLGVSPGLGGLKERASDIVIANQRELEWQPRFLRETERRRVGRVGNAEHQIGGWGGGDGRRAAGPRSAPRAGGAPPD